MPGLEELLAPALKTLAVLIDKNYNPPSELIVSEGLRFESHSHREAIHSWRLPEFIVVKRHAI